MNSHNASLYAADPPPQVASAFVLQHLLSVPAQASAFAAATGPWLVELGTLDSSQVSFDLAPGLYPQRVGFTRATATAAGLDERIERAHAAYTALGTEIVDRYDGDVKASTRQRYGMVQDMWALALREARLATGQAPGPAVERASCCFIFALPGCHECGGCPRLAVT